MGLGEGRFGSDLLVDFSDQVPMMASPLGGPEAAGGETQETIPGGLVILGDCSLNHRGQLPGGDFSRATWDPFQDFHGVSVW